MQKDKLLEIANNVIFSEQLIFDLIIRSQFRISRSISYHKAANYQSQV